MKLHVETPLIESRTLSKLVGFKVWLKLENSQPTLSFKVRGIGNCCNKAVENGATHLICSSGGSAGLAMAYCARKLGVQSTVVVPETTPQPSIGRLLNEGADVIVHGKVWNEANDHAMNLCRDYRATLVHPFDDSDIWEGHSKIVDEIADTGLVPDCVVTCVGGGGLLVGLVHGLRSKGWDDVPVIAMETEGANSYSEAIKAGHVVTIPGITSVAKCLGSTTVCQEALDLYNKHPIISRLATDSQAVSSCSKFLDDHCILVSPACGAALSAVYCGFLQDAISTGEIRRPVEEVVLIVCGGLNSIGHLNQLKTDLGL